MAGEAIEDAHEQLTEGADSQALPQGLQHLMQFLQKALGEPAWLQVGGLARLQWVLQQLVGELQHRIG